MDLCFLSYFPAYVQPNVSQANQLKCVIIRGILACDYEIGSLIAVGVGAGDSPVILNGAAAVTLLLLKYINSFYYPAQQEPRHPADCQISDTRLIE